MDSNLLGKQNYNLLLRWLERFPGQIDLYYNGATIRQMLLYGDRTALSKTAKPLLVDIDKAPLYVLSSSSEARVSALVADPADPLGIPTIPERGVTLSDSKSAVYIEPADSVIPDWYKDIAKKRFIQRDDSLVHTVSIECYRICVGIQDPDHSKTAFVLADIIALPRTAKAPYGIFTAWKLLAAIQVNDGVIGWHFTEVIKKAHVNEEAGVLSRLVITSGDGLKQIDDRSVSIDETTEVLHQIEHQSRTALQQLRYIDMSPHFVIEERYVNVDLERKFNEKKTARVDDREHWIILDPEEVQIMRSARTDAVEPIGTHASPIPHRRRGYQKTLRSERYKYKRGSVIYIRPTWVGDREWVNGKLCYRVVSRIGSKGDQA
jgi:hypothetical protein